ncbi:hypothetical protein [Runella zeae]|uniref:hypothetical protein n=1 Tax=Runella zeae TaxID=94255 RepID=UPI00040A7343|nr:hypothetical protein [Runella zeae]
MPDKITLTREAYRKAYTDQLEVIQILKKKAIGLAECLPDFADQLLEVTIEIVQAQAKFEAIQSIWYDNK